MEYRERQYPLFSACGLNCGLCTRHQTEGKSRCPGCAGENFSAVHPACGVLSCCQRRGHEYCYECEAYPCEKYTGADAADSFITHLHQFSDMEKAETLGIIAYQNELDEKIAILEKLLTVYNDGRRKSFYCLAVNLLTLADVRAVMAVIEAECQPDWSVKEKAKAAAHVFQETAEKRGLSLKLRKKAK